MPARVITAKLSTDPGQISRTIQTLAGFADDPIAQVRSRFGPLLVTSRRLTMEVVDRLDRRYPPTSFRDARGRSPGRWLVWWYISDTQFGPPAGVGVSYPTGNWRELATLGDVRLTHTDATGVIQADVDKTSGAEGWVHTGVIGLLRPRGINWATGADAPDDQAATGDPPVPPSGPPVVSE